VVIQPIEIPLIIKLIFYFILFLGLTIAAIYDLFRNAGTEVTHKDNLKIVFISVSFWLVLILGSGIWDDVYNH
jgi:hypothetical protein